MDGSKDCPASTPSGRALARRTLRSVPDGQAGILDQLRQHGLGLEVSLGDRPCRPAVSFVVGIDSLEGRHDVLHAVEREQPFARRDEFPEGGVLGDDRAARAEVAGAAIAEPAGPELPMDRLGTPELGARPPEYRW